MLPSYLQKVNDWGLERIETLIFYLLIFFIPVQTRVILHSWTQPFNQWTSAYLHGTDILLAAIFILWFLRIYRHRKSISLTTSLTTSQVVRFWRLINPTIWLMLSFALSALSIFNSRMIGLSFYQLLKLAEFVVFYFYLQHNLGKIFQLRTVLIVVIASGFFQSLIAIAQYIKQGSIGLRLLGESPLSADATGVAVFIADGVKYLRAYGTTPHPNILAAWLFMAIFAFYFHYLHKAIIDPKQFTYKSDRSYIRLTEMIIYGVLLFALFFTFSRVIVGLWLAGVAARLLIVFFKRDLRGFFAVAKKPLLALIVTTIVVAVAFSIMFWPQVKSRIRITAQEEAVTQRVFYNKIAGSVAADHSLLGIGIGQFVSSMMSKFKYLPANAYQPAHNIYLLIASETGFLGLGAFLMFLFLTFWNFIKKADLRQLRNFSFLIFALSFLAVGLFDHFLLTLQQGGLIFWMVLTLMSVAIPQFEPKSGN